MKRFFFFALGEDGDKNFGRLEIGRHFAMSDRDHRLGAGGPIKEFGGNGLELAGDFVDAVGHFICR